MNIDTFRQLLEQDEGVKYEVYLDHLEKATTGIGHLITQQDVEYSYLVGAPVSEERVAELFEQDVRSCLQDCYKLQPNFDELPEPVQLTVASLAFQLGLPRYSKFKKHHAAMDQEVPDWIEAANQLRDSKLYRQTPERTERHAKRLEAA
jgi:lysozyme